MDRILTGNIWKQISVAANKARQRQAALAYVTSSDYIKFRAGDILICDASDKKIRSGETDASTLEAFFDAGAKLYSCKSLHAKILVYGSNVLVGSCNLSSSSAETLREAALLSTRSSIRLQAEKFIAQTIQASQLIDRKFINRISKIEVAEKTYGIGSKKTLAGGKQSPTLLQALEQKAPIIHDFVYMWFYTDNAISELVVKSEVAKQDALPSSLRKSEWEWFAWDEKRGLAQKIDQAFKGRQCINFEVRRNSEGEIDSFRRLRSSATYYSKTIRIKVRNKAHRLLVDLKQKQVPGLILSGNAWSSDLCKILTAGIQQNPRLRKTLRDRVTSTITSKELLHLYETGVAALKPQKK